MIARKWISIATPPRSACAHKMQRNWRLLETLIIRVKFSYDSHPILFLLCDGGVENSIQEPLRGCEAWTWRIISSFSTLTTSELFEGSLWSLRVAPGILGKNPPSLSTWSMNTLNRLTPFCSLHCSDAAANKLAGTVSELLVLDNGYLLLRRWNAAFSASMALSFPTKCSSFSVSKRSICSRPFLRSLVVFVAQILSRIKLESKPVLFLIRVIDSKASTTRGSFGFTVRSDR